VTTPSKGARVQAKSADGKMLTRRALTGVVMGQDFPVVWICREEEWEAAEQEGREPEGVPWPAEDVEPDVNETAYRIVQEATREDEG
jgi:hypothetical protein